MNTPRAMCPLISAALLLGLGLAAPVAQAERPDRGADYGDQKSRGERSVSSKPARSEAGRGGREVEARDSWRGRGEREERAREDAWPRERDQNTRIAGFQGGYRETERPRGREPEWQGDHWGQDRRDRWEHRDSRQDRHWQSERQVYRDDHRHKDWGRSDWRGQERYRHDWRHPEWRHHWRHGWSGSRYRAPVRYVYPRGYRSVSWRIGYQLPAVFFASDWFVDWRYYRLAAPPWGCRWLRVDGDLLLVDERSGEIVDILYGFFYY